MSDDTILNFHGLARVLAEQDFHTVRVRWLDSLARIQPFPFGRLPVEIAIIILKFATTKSSVYSALMRTSRTIAGLARLECVPEAVLLSHRESAISFYACISVYPDVGAAVKELWFFPALPSSQAASIGSAIPNACCNVERLACFPDVLIDMCSGSTFRHTSLADVTLMDTNLPWDRLLGARHAAIFFNQVQRLRLIGNGGTPPAIPPHGTSFPTLAELTVTSRTATCLQTYLLDRTRFPNLTRAVVAVPYMEWRDIGSNYLMSEPALADGRLCIVHCTKKWKELDVWKKGAFSIWNMGVTEWNALARSTGSSQKAWK
ncbi:hypothetical protein B0H17DRAFT_1229403 [Mycena rosella]|uniref:Uncharacterized protein n=1 Tax=Mycena rosella TaxID=1033263 RepID=A0AAD7D8D9_MYCRO|nr:hypothetical protein B0H17DRAFT_1229403 [Mycena rosella]